MRSEKKCGGMQEGDGHGCDDKLKENMTGRQEGVEVGDREEIKPPRRRPAADIAVLENTAPCGNVF